MAADRPLELPLNHSARIDVVAFSPDGKIALTAEGREVRLWDSATGKLLRAPFVHDGWGVGFPIGVRAAVFSSDGRTILTSFGDLHLWDAVTGKAIGPPLPLSYSPLGGLAFSPDGNSILIGAGRVALLVNLAPVQRDPEAVVLWTQVITGMEQNDVGVVQMLDAATWQQRRRRLREMGGSPLPHDASPGPVRALPTGSTASK